MIESTNKKRTIIHLIIGLIILVWSFAVLDEGFYMDESGLLSVYKGIYQGNRLFIDSWGPHQLGGLLTYPLFALYYEVLEPIIYPLGCGFVLYMRICYQGIRLFISVYLYFTIRQTKYIDSAFVVSSMYYMFFVSFKNLSYKSMCEMAIALFICWGYRYFDTKKTGYIVLMALATCVAILAYPTMILFPFLFVIYMLIMSYNGFSFKSQIIAYSVVCILCGLAVLIYVQCTSGMSNVISQIAYTEDAAYKYPIYIRSGIMLASYCFFAVVAYIPIVVMKIIEKFRYIEDTTRQITLAVYWIIFVAAIILLRPQSVSTTRYIHGCLVLFFWYIYFSKDRDYSQYTTVGKYKQADFTNKEVMGFVLFVSVVTQLIWSVSTNQEVTVPGHMSIYAVLLLMMMAEEYEGLKILRYAVFALTVFFMGVWIPESDGGYNDIFESRTYVADGAYRGIALDEVDYAMNASCYDLLEKYVSADDYLYVVNGYGATGYLNSDAHQAAGSPFSRVGVGQNRVLEYWQVNPDNQADYILIDKANKYYEEFLQGETAAYIYENYTTLVDTNGDVELWTR